MSLPNTSAEANRATPTSSSTSKPDFFKQKTEVSEIKHGVLSRYLAAWLPILTHNRWRKYERIVYVDGFAGPGIYSDTQDGSPAVIYRLALTHKNLNMNGPEICLIFNEKSISHCLELARNLNSIYLQNTNAKNVHQVKYMVINGEFVTSMKWIISAGFSFEPTLEGYQTAPTSLESITPGNGRNFITWDTPLFVFADPFGYNGQHMPMTLMREIFETSQKSEILVNLMTGFIRRFFNLDNRTRPINLLIGDDEYDASWKPFVLEGTDSQEKLANFLKFYDDKLCEGSELCETRFTSLFEMRDKGNRLLYNLYFASHHNKGFQEMKNAMRKESQDEENFKFSAFDAKKPEFHRKEVSFPQLAQTIADHFRGKGHVTGSQITEFLESTPNYTQRYKTHLKKAFSEFRVASSTRKRKFDEMEFDFPISDADNDANGENATDQL